jgi:thioredoxin-related protein
MKKPIIGLVPLFDDEKESLWMLPGYMDDNSKLIFREFVKHCQEL